MWCKIELAEHMSVVEMEKISHLAMQDTIGISTFTIDLCAVYIPPSEADYMRKNISTSPDRNMQFPGPGKSVVEWRLQCTDNKPVFIDPQGSPHVFS